MPSIPNSIPFVDIHCHPTMKPFYSSVKHIDKNNIWEYIPESEACGIINENPRWPIEKLIVKELDLMSKSSQTNLKSCQKGDVRVLFISLYPVERGWFKIRYSADVLTDNEFMTQSTICSSGFNEAVVREIERIINDKEPINYFDELVKEYDYLNSSQARLADIKKQFIIANSYEDIKTVIDKPEDNIVLILSIEGGHSLCNFQNYDDLKNTPFHKVNNSKSKEFIKYSNLFLHHINIIKGKEEINIKRDGIEKTIHFKHTPFYITFAHHFWNLLCGHADSFGTGADFALDQHIGKEKKFSALGKLVLRKLLFRDANERRILIDIKHLSLKARREFFNIWQNEYQAIGDGFPIICSHTAVNGRYTYQHTDMIDEDFDAYFFNTASINMYDPDIKMIHKSGGLIGIILSQSRLLGSETLSTVKHHLKQIRKHPNRKAKLSAANKRIFIKAILANIFHIIRVIGKKSAWDIISIGSDFDGMINGLKGYDKAENYLDLYNDMNDYIENDNGIKEINLSRNEMKQLMFNYSSQEIIEKIMSKNALVFTRRYFHDGFLKNGIIG